MGRHVRAGAGGTATSVPPLRAPRWAVTRVTAPLWRRRMNQQRLHSCSLSEGLPSPSLTSPTGVTGSPGNHRLLDLGSPASLTLSVPGRGCPVASRVRWPVHAAHRGNGDVIQPTLAQLHPNSGEDFTDTPDLLSGEWRWGQPVAPLLSPQPAARRPTSLLVSPLCHALLLSCPSPPHGHGSPLGVHPNPGTPSFSHLPSGEDQSPQLAWGGGAEGTGCTCCGGGKGVTVPRVMGTAVLGGGGG